MWLILFVAGSCLGLLGTMWQLLYTHTEATDMCQTAFAAAQKAGGFSPALDQRLRQGLAEKGIDLRPGDLTYMPAMGERAQKRTPMLLVLTPGYRVQPFGGEAMVLQGPSIEVQGYSHRYDKGLE